MRMNYQHAMHFYWWKKQSQNFSILRTTFVHSMYSLKVRRVVQLIRITQGPKLTKSYYLECFRLSSHREKKCRQGVASTLKWPSLQSYVTLLLTISSLTRRSHTVPLNHKGTGHAVLPCPEEKRAWKVWYTYCAMLSANILLEHNFQ